MSGKKPKPQVSVWLGDGLRAEVATWAKHQGFSSESGAIKALTQRGLHAIWVSNDLKEVIENRYKDYARGLIVKPTRDQYVEGLLRSMLSGAEPDGLDFRHPTPPIR